MEEKVKTRIAELEQAEQETATRLMAIRTVMAELRALIAPEPTITTDEQEG